MCYVPETNDLLTPGHGFWWVSIRCIKFTHLTTVIQSHNMFGVEIAVKETYVVVTQIMTKQNFSSNFLDKCQRNLCQRVHSFSALE